MIEKPKLPDPEDLQYRKQQFLLTIFEQYEESSKIWFIILVGLLVLAFPLKILLQETLVRSFLAGYTPPVVNYVPYTPLDLKLVGVQTLPVIGDRYSVIAQVLNPNVDLSARRFEYMLILKNAAGKKLGELSGENYMLAGESKYLIFPDVRLAEQPAGSDLEFEGGNWTRFVPPHETKLEVIQQNYGVTTEGQFFVEGLLKNLENWQIKKVEVKAIVWDRTFQNIVAANSTILNDIKSFESRYFRMIWPKKFDSVGRIQLTPAVNPFDPGLILSDPEKIPIR